MNKKDIFNDFKHLNFNRVSRKQKKKALNFITHSLEGKYKMNIQPKWYKCLFFIPWKKCYNIESENPNYEILLTAHYDTHGWRMGYIQSFIARKIQYSNKFHKMLFILLNAFTIFSLGFVLTIKFKISIFLGALLCFSLLVLWLMGLPIYISSIFYPFKSAPVHDDNNSGVVTLIHLAKLLEEKGYSHKVKLLFTDCEENGILGSQVFIKNNLETLQNKVIINFDSVGRGSNLFITANNGSIQAKNLQYLFLSKGIHSTLFTKSFSDDSSFSKKHLKAIGLIRVDKDGKGSKIINWTHTSHDTLENININYITEIIETVAEFITEIL